MNLEQILKWCVIVSVLILCLSFLFVVRSYLAQDVRYVQYDDLTNETQVLFMGNSYTVSNDLPQMFSALADEGGHRVSVAMVVQGGWTLQKHVRSKETLDSLRRSGWDYVVLQEQSVIPSRSIARTVRMYPAVRHLIEEIDELGGEGILFMTWGRRDGLGPSPSDDFKAMQAELKDGYLGIANELDVIVSPVGVAWQSAVEKDPQLDLWAADGSHPSVAGSYLAACVFYAVIFEESPEGLKSVAGLPEKTAQLLQSIAAETVLEDLELWNIR